MSRWSFAVVLWVLAGCAATQGAPPRTASSHAGSPSASAPRPATGDAGDPAQDPGDAAGDAEDEPEDDGEEEEIDDGLELPPIASAPAAPPPSPLAAMTDAEIEDKLLHDPASLGSISLGSTNAGRLLNGVQMPDGEGWQHLDRAHAWGTQETVDSLIRAIGEVRRTCPDSPPLYVGHISARQGGPLSPHISHQAGRDVDISYYLTDRRPGFRRATAKNLDLERTWAFVRALIIETDVELILIDTSVQRLLKAHALKIGEDPGWIDGLFQIGSKHHRPLIRHARGHGNHLHVRFYNPIAQSSAARAHAVLAKQGKVQPAVAYVRHVVKNGQTLGILARRYGTTVEAIQRANGLKGTFIKAKRVLNIPRPGQASAPPRLAPPVIPPRRLPPPRSAAVPQGSGPA
jgi:penicillin-insensitive murein endopeptidase